MRMVSACRLERRISQTGKAIGKGFCKCLSTLPGIPSAFSSDMLVCSHKPILVLLKIVVNWSIRDLFKVTSLGSKGCLCRVIIDYYIIGC